MKKKELLFRIKKILVSKRVIKKNINTKDFLNLNIFDNEKIDSLALATIISELEIISKKNIDLTYFKIKKNQSIKRVLDNLLK